MGGAGGGGGAGGAGGAGGPLTCTTGELFAGNPLHDDPMLRPESGSPLRSDPPLHYRTLLFDGDTLYTHVGQEVWYVDLAEANPVQRRLVGQEIRDRTADFKDGPCADARLGNTHGLALLPDHSLVVADFNANALVHVTDPRGPNCAMNYLAGTHEDIEGLGGEVPNQGDVDGPGLQAQFAGVKWVTAAPDGTVYFVDEGNGKIKKISIGGDNPVSTVARIGPATGGSEGAQVVSMIWHEGKLYTAITGGDSFIHEWDPATGEARQIIGGRGDVFDPDLLDSSSSAEPQALVAVGGELLVGSLRGVLWAVNIADGSVRRVAGSGLRAFDFPPADYDPSVPHPVAELHLPSLSQAATQSTGIFLGFRQGHVYWAARAPGDTYVMDISCE